jgi:DNA-binding PadR family transcriptional regulator
VASERELAPGEWSVLALLAERPGHGWALAAQMARTGSIGKVWSLGRPLVYRALDTLADRGLIEAVGDEPGARGPHRTIFAATGRGRQALLEWLHEPVGHVREVRSLFLLKLVLLERADLPLRPLLEAQRTQMEPAIEQLEARLRASGKGESIFVRFRLETTRAVLEFIVSQLAEQPRAVSKLA